MCVGCVCVHKSLKICLSNICEDKPSSLQVLSVMANIATTCTQQMYIPLAATFQFTARLPCQLLVTCRCPWLPRGTCSSMKNKAKQP